MAKVHWYSRLTGGRPMRPAVDPLGFHYAFTDAVAHKPVYYWLDHFGRPWLATSRWSGFRVETPTPSPRPSGG